MKPFLLRWASTTFAVLVASAFVPGITADSFGALVWAGLLLGVLNAVLRPVLLLLALPVVVLSMGLFILVINAFLLHLVGGGWINGFHVAGFGSAFLGGIVVSLASWIVNGFLKGSGNGGFRFEFRQFPSSRPYGNAPYEAGSAPYEPTAPYAAPRPGELKPVEGRVIESHEPDPNPPRP